MVADESLTVVFRFAANQTGKIFQPHVVASFVWSFNREQVDMMTTLALFTHIQRHKATHITSTQDVPTDRRILFLEFWYVFYGHGKGEAGKVKRVFIRFVVRETIRVMFSWV